MTHFFYVLLKTMVLLFAITTLLQGYVEVKANIKYDKPIASATWILPSICFALFYFLSQFNR